MNARRRMEIGDWANGAALFGVGVCLGLVIDALLQLSGTAFWFMAIIIVVLFGAVLVFDTLLNALFERIFPIGIKPSGKKERKPLALVFCVPTGIVIGLIGAQFGLTELLF